MSAQTSPVARRDSRAETNVVVWASISAIGVLLASAVLLIALSLLSWATDRPVGSTAGSASKVAMQAWYLAHSVPLPVSWGSLSVPPLLVTGFIAVLFYRSGRGAVRACGLRTPIRIAEALAAIVITYVTCAVLLSSIAYSSDPMLSIWDVVLGTGSLAVVASLAGLLRESGLGARLIAALPGPSYAYARGALATCWSLAAMSALAVGVSLIINYSETSALTAALSPNGLGGLTVIGISIAYLPNAMLLATALGTGTGFNLGDGSLYSLGAVDREALPIFPLFSALPHEAGGLAILSVLVPLVAAVIGALAMTRHLEPEHRTASNLLVGSAMCSVLTAVGVLGVGLYAAGGLGDGRLSAVGVSPWRLAIFLVIELMVAVAVTAFIATRRSMKPVSVARREKALSVLERGSKTPDADVEADAGVDADSSSGADLGSSADLGSGSGNDGSTDDDASSTGRGNRRAKGATGKGSAGKRAGSKTSTGKGSAGKTATGKGAAGKGSAGKTATGRSAAGKRKASGAPDVDALGPDASDAEISGAVDGSAVAELEPDSATRPVIVSKLAMRRLARNAKRSAKVQNAAAIKKNPEAAPKTAPAASLSVVKQARAAQAKATSKPAPKSAAKPATKFAGESATKPATQPVAKPKTSPPTKPE